MKTLGPCGLVFAVLLPVAAGWCAGYWEVKVAVEAGNKKSSAVRVGNGPNALAFDAVSGFITIAHAGGTWQILPQGEASADAEPVPHGASTLEFRLHGDETKQGRISGVVNGWSADGTPYRKTVSLAVPHGWREPKPGAPKKWSGDLAELSSDCGGITGFSMRWVSAGSIFLVR